MKVLIKNAWLVTMDANRRIIGGGAIAIEDNRIVAVDKTQKIEKELKADKIIDASGKIVMPGLICTHCHTHGRASIGMPAPMPSEFYGVLHDWWWPLIEDTLTKEDVYTLAKASCAQMLRNGTTCIADVMEAPHALPQVLNSEAKAFLDVWMRGVLSFEATERISRENGELGTQENLSFVKEWNAKPDTLVRGRFGVHTVFTCSPEMLRKVRDLANKHGGGIHLHVEESRYEVEYSKKTYGKLPLEHLRGIGFLNSDVQAAQCVHTSESEIKILKEKDVKVSHNPQSNMECGVGIAPIPKMLEEGIVIGLGNDGLTPDMFETMRTTFLVHKGHLEDAAVLPADKVLEMATIDGAKVVGLEREIGSLEVGKKADLIILKLKAPTAVTQENLCYQIVMMGQGNDVETVMVDGKIIMEDRKLLSINEEEAYRSALETSTDMWRRNELI